MATLNEFSSLLQLGAGIGIGLSIFRAPLELRSSRLRSEIERQRAVLTGVSTCPASAKLADLSSIHLSFVEKEIKLKALQKPFMIATVVFAFLNLGGLIWASVDATHVLGAYEMAAALFISVGYYVVVAAILELIARSLFDDVSRQLQEWLQSRSN